MPLTRFGSDLHYAETFFDLYCAFTTYLEKQFDISEDAAMQIYVGAASQLPDAALYEADRAIAEEQMRLGLVRVALPLAENLYGHHDEFSSWVRDLARNAMNAQDDSHNVDDCVVSRHRVSEFGCDKGDNCPVKVVKYLLIDDGMNPDFQSLDYQGEMTGEKIQRTIAKLSAAQSLGLIVGNEASTIRRNYMLRVKTHTAFTPENDDI